jgi:hypothetical protein
VTRTKPSNSLYSGEEKTLACEETWLPGCGRKEKEIMRVHKMRLLFIVSIIVLFQGIQLVAAYDWNDIDPPYQDSDCDWDGAQASVSESEYGLTYFKIYHPSSGVQWTWTYFYGDYDITNYSHVAVTFTGVLDAYIRGTFILWPYTVGYASITIRVGLVEEGVGLYDWKDVYYNIEWNDDEDEIYEVFTKGEVYGTFHIFAPAHNYAPAVWIYAYATGSESEVTIDDSSTSSAYLTVSCISWDDY